MQGGAGAATASSRGPLPASSGASGNRRITREELVRVGQARQPWAFLPLGLQALHQLSEDVGLRLLVAANWAMAGLRTAAAETLSRLPAQAMELAEVRALAEAIQKLPPDVIPTDQRISTARANVNALGAGGPDANEAFESWARRAGEFEHFRAMDGNVIRRRAARELGSAAGPWLGVSDQVTVARRMDEQMAADARAADKPVVIEGVDPPWFLERVLKRRVGRTDMHRPRITIVQADSDEFFDGLSLLDLSNLLAEDEPSVRALVGADAGERLREHLRGMLDFSITGPVVSLMTVRTRMTPAVSEIVNAIGAEQQTYTERLHAEVDAVYAGRDLAWWARRYEEAFSGRGEPLRVLVPTARNSTFVKHASADLVEAFRALGHRAELLIEPDDSTRMAAGSYLRMFAELKPDLVVLINYPRVMMGSAIPANVPHVCWLQDAMPHLFRPEMGAAHGPLDFVAGHLFEELFAAHGYPRDRAMESAVLASEWKFHAGPVGGSPAIHTNERKRFECEIAYVSHQSETPEAQHQRLREEFASKMGVKRAIDALRGVIDRALAWPVAAVMPISASDWSREALRDELGREPEAELVDTVARAYAQPYADRVMRHEALGWAAEVAERRGWRMKLYGRGWEKHSRLGAFAAGELGHGDDLRCSYQTASVHLHMTVHALVHQRVIECLLSGGFPLCRLHSPELNEITTWMVRLGLEQGARPVDVPTDVHVPDGWSVLGWADAPALMKMASLVQNLGLNEYYHRYGHPGPVVETALIEQWRDQPAHRPDRFSAYWLLAEQAEPFFHDAATLEGRIAMAVEKPAVRRAVSAAARRRIAGRCTYTGLAERMAGFVRDGLVRQAGSPIVGAAAGSGSDAAGECHPMTTGDRKNAA